MQINFFAGYTGILVDYLKLQPYRHNLIDLFPFFLWRWRSSFLKRRIARLVTCHLSTEIKIKVLPTHIDRQLHKKVVDPLYFLYVTS